MRLRCNSDGSEVLVDTNQPLGMGGEGTVYPVVGRPLVAKVYHAQTRLDLGRQRRKLAAMVARPPVDPERVRGSLGLAWPADLLDAADGRLVGYLMPRVDLGEATPLLDLTNPRRRLSQWPGATWRLSLQAALCLCALVQSVHEQGYIIGDVSELNSYVHRDGHVVLLDCDSFGVRVADEVYACPVGRPAFVAPELQGRRLDGVPRTRDQDHFALAILIYRLLQEGEHPFGAVAQGQTWSIEASIARGAFARVAGGQPRPSAPPYGLLSPSLRALCERAFVAGHRHPERRPSAAEWRAALAGMAQSLRLCTANRWHVYGGHLPSCPWCVRARTLGLDVWPAAGCR